MASISLTGGRDAIPEVDGQHLLCFDGERLRKGDDPLLIDQEPAVRSETNLIPGKRPAGRSSEHRAVRVENTSMARAFPSVPFGDPIHRAPEMRAYAGNHLDKIFLTHHKYPSVGKKVHTLLIIIYSSDFKFFRRFIKDIGNQIARGGGRHPSESSQGGKPAKVIQEITS